MIFFTQWQEVATASVESGLLSLSGKSLCHLSYRGLGGEQIEPEGMRTRSKNGLSLILMSEDTG